MQSPASEPVRTTRVLIVLAALWAPVVLLVWLARSEVVPWAAAGVALAGAIVLTLVCAIERSLSADAALRRSTPPSALASEEPGWTQHPAEHRAMLDAVAGGVLVLDRAGVVLHCNKEFAGLVGRGPATMAGWTVDRLFTQASMLTLHTAALGHSPATAHLMLGAEGASRVIEVVAIAVRDGSRVVLTFRDISELAHAAQLKTDFVANASHELRTPLTAILLATETLREGAWEDPLMRERLFGVLSDHTGRLEDLIQDLLDLSRLESPEPALNPEEVELPGLVQELRGTFAGVCAQRGLTIRSEVAPGAGLLRADRRLLHAVLKNLVENATKYADEGSTIRVTCSRIGERTHAGAREGRVELRVIDRGVGIALGHQARIFERFYQADPARTEAQARRGTGLGLAIVKHAVRSMGGTVRVESVWKEGTTMIVELPG